ncbi:MAG: sigma-70 family RNA polymerase sigma factor [Clostridia bacterium]|nr:sigma-70 family RNA polymerase sigma factor [Clostridia bacterium]
MSRDSFICDNLGLVHACARRFIGRGLEYDDLFQAGCVGLVKAADGFEAERGLQFSTYAVPVILGEIRHLFRQGGTVKVSRSLKELSLRATRVRETLAIEQGREPTVEELATALGVEPALAAQAITAALPPLSLTRHDEDEDGEQIDLPTASPEEQITDRLALQQLLEGLEPRDRQLIRLRYLAHQTQQATADRLGMTQVQVSRRERALLLQLRQQLTG